MPSTYVYMVKIPRVDNGYAPPQPRPALAHYIFREYRLNHPPALSWGIVVVTTERSRLEQLVANPGKVDTQKIPEQLRTNIDSWKWGQTGWTSPANLIITAAWRKTFHPDEDCCKIWARDSANQPISGGYSIRTCDETVTVPVFSQFDLCTGFCSANSGMQGSRAIEKSRGVMRINRGLKLEQRTVFDSELFAEILNDINLLDQNAAEETLKYLIEIAYKAKAKRDSANVVLAKSPPAIDLLKFCADMQDPELTKCIAAACLDAMYSGLNYEISGVTDHKTAADNRAVKAGDLALFCDGKPVVAVEVKDRSRSLDWQNINGARAIIENFPSLMAFYFVLESRAAIRVELMNEVSSRELTGEGLGVPISFVSLPDLVAMATPYKGYSYLVTRTAEFVTQAPSIKPSTKELWVQKSQTAKTGNG